MTVKRIDLFILNDVENITEGNKDESRPNCTSTTTME